MQGPPGTGKTRTILGLLSIVLHAAPAGSAGMAKSKAAAQPMPEYSRADLIRLWAKASPWLAGARDPRWELLWPLPAALHDAAGSNALKTSTVMRQLLAWRSMRGRACHHMPPVCHYGGGQRTASDSSLWKAVMHEGAVRRAGALTHRRVWGFPRVSKNFTLC
jgi:hypothetical protein